MVEMHVEGDQLVCEIEGMHKFWACKSSLKIPLEHIESVQARPEEAQNWWHGWKKIVLEQWIQGTVSRNDSKPATTSNNSSSIAP